MAEDSSVVPTSSSLPPRHTLVDRRKKQKCRYFFNHGCRAGAGCPFSHEKAATTTGKHIDPASSHSKSDQSSLNQDHQGAQGPHGTTQNVGTGVSGQGISSSGPPPVRKEPRPISNTEKVDPRLFQMNQVRRRFSPEEREDGSATVLDIKLTPTDPDFPFEMTNLRCTLSVPHSYPGKGLPSLRVSNSEMDRGYQINVERGFDSLAASTPKRTLLTLMNELDKRLESFLVAEKVQTIKLVANAGRPTPTKPVVPVAGMSAPPSTPDFTPVQLGDAAEKRESDVQEMETQLQHQPLFAVSEDGLSFMIPIEKSSEFPASLKHIDYINLYVPTLYNLEPCTVSFDDITSPDAVNVAAAFEHYVRLHSDKTLVAHVDHLLRNMHILAEGPKAKGGAVVIQTNTEDSDRPHVQYIAKPPEWDNQWADGDEDDSSDSYDSGDESEEDGGLALPSVSEVEAADVGPDLGVRLSFPSLELYGIELLQLASVSLTVKCDRCKEEKDVKNVQSHSANDQSLIKRDSCSKCAGPFSISYRSELMHAASVRAGYLDLDGCTVTDLLPSTFIPTCSNCSTPQPNPIVSFRGESTTSNCRECHKPLTFKIPDLKFLRITTSSTSSKLRPLPPRKKPKETLGIVSGTELPRRGRCTHYAKSYRWFRFSCCAKVYPCDRCHEENEAHVVEHATRMICGFCSREQHYRPEDCIHCHTSLVKKVGSGFWEGGKGTRDPKRMRKGDKRKYRHRNVGGGRDREEKKDKAKKKA